MTRLSWKSLLIVLVSLQACASQPVQIKWYVARPSQTVPPGGLSRKVGGQSEFISWWNTNGMFCTDAEGIQDHLGPPPMDGPPL